MGLARRSHAPRRVRLAASAWTSFGVLAVLLATCAASAAFGSESRRLSSYPDDAVIDTPYGEASNRWLVFLHVLGIAYMLLGLNTVCDVYFCSALDVMVERWHVKPDVAGATFMAAGGSAPELFTSLLGTLVTQDDVGFGTIVGSAIFNVLFVIGLCGWVAKEEIKLTWWPLFRDCTSYMVGLSFLAWVASDEIVRLGEAVMLFLLYIAYCILMYNNGRVEALFDVELWRAKKKATDAAAAQPSVITTQFVAVKPQQKAELAGAVPQPCMQNAWADAEEEIARCEAAAGQASSCAEGKEQGTQDAPNLHSPPKAAAAAPRTGSKQRRSSTAAADPEAAMISAMAGRRHSRRVDSLIRHADMLQLETAMRREGRLKGSTPSHGPETGITASPVDPVKESVTAEDLGTSEEPEAECETEQDDAAENLLAMPEEGLGQKIMWCLCLPVYVPLHFSIPSGEDWYLVTFVLSLLWIAGFSFFMVWWVEILGEVLHIPNVIMGYTLLAAGTSIPDAVSSVAVARMGEGDMSVSSSIGSNIFDILVGLPIPWMIKLVADLVAGRTSEVRILSPYLTFFVLLLLIMVFAVILSIHVIGWKLSRRLGACMAVLYLAFLVTCVTVEETNPTWLRF